MRYLANTTLLMSDDANYDNYLYCCTQCSSDYLRTFKDSMSWEFTDFSKTERQNLKTLAQCCLVAINFHLGHLQPNTLIDGFLYLYFSFQQCKRLVAS